MAKRIFFCAGEVSGDRHGAALAKAIRGIDSEVEFFGIGGTQMKAAGVELLHDSTGWGTIGFFEGATRFPRLYPIFRKIPKIFDRERPDMFVPIDFRVFNMGLCRAAKTRGIPVTYFFAPVSWYGTGKKRFAELAESVDLALICLPFSLGDYELAGANFEYVGHPAVDLAQPEMEMEEAFKTFGLERGRVTIGLMPGSRIQEIKRLLPVFRDAAELLRNSVPGSQFILLSADARFTPLIRKILRDTTVTVTESHPYDFMNVCDLLIVCSGTATHEATLMEKPMVVTYRLSRPTAALARLMMKYTYVAMPNLLAGEMVVPELIQERCTAGNIALEAHRLLTDSEARVALRRKYQEVKMMLGAPGVLDRSAERIVNALNGKWDTEEIPFRRKKIPAMAQ
ncbi:MAG: lipid-A-disaccharide synthase [bacterium]